MRTHSTDEQRSHGRMSPEQSRGSQRESGLDIVEAEDFAVELLVELHELVPNGRAECLSGEEALELATLFQDHELLVQNGSPPRQQRSRCRGRP